MPRLPYLILCEDNMHSHLLTSLISFIFVGHHTAPTNEQGLTALSSALQQLFSPLTPVQDKKIRAIIAACPPYFITPSKSCYLVVLVPDDLSKLYKSHPIGVLDLLVRVADGGSPLESVTAATYALALLDPMGGGIICASGFDRNTYDDIVNAWGETPRYHWINIIKQTAKR